MDRDLLADFAASIGTPPADLHVDSVVLRGQVSVSTINLSPPTSGGTPLSVAPVVGSANWQPVDGRGQLSVDGSGPSSEAVVVVNPERSDHRVDEADTVAIRTPAGGLLVAVGTIQWSWALDNFGEHKDSHGNYTPVDARLQVLTRNILNALRAG
jgi:hypothetical protein